MFKNVLGILEAQNILKTFGPKCKRSYIKRLSVILMEESEKISPGEQALLSACVGIDKFNGRTIQMIVKIACRNSRTEHNCV